MRIRDFQRYNDLRNNTKHWDLPRWGNALAGEVGEACNIIKKIDRDGDPDGITTAMLGGELCDILSYLCMLATKAGVDLQSSAGIKFNEVTKRPERKFKDIIIPEEEFL